MPHFELAPASKLAELACTATNQAVEAWEKNQGTKRLKPGELLLEQEGEKLVIPCWPRRTAPPEGGQLSPGCVPGTGNAPIFKT